MKRRQTYQHGTLIIENRKKGPDVWTYRYSELDEGVRRRRKLILGTLALYPTRVAAEHALEHLRLVANQGSLSPSCPNCGALIDRYIELVLRPALDLPVGGVQDTSSPVSFHCAKGYLSVLNRWVRPRWGEYRIPEFSKPAVRASIEAWLRSLWHSPQNPRGLAPKTVRSVYNVMRLVFKFGVKWGYLEQNPMAEQRVELPRGSTKRLKQPTQLTAVQFFSLLGGLELREKLAVAFAGWLGPRVSEAFGLKWQDLDLEHGVVSFRQGFVHGRISPLKTEASRTKLPQPEEVRALLLQWRTQTPYRLEEDWVFASPYTRGQRPTWPGQLLKDHIQPIAKKLGLPRIGWHSFRHSVSAWGKQAGLGLEAVKTLLRHENIATTSNLYGAMDLESKRRSQEQLMDFVKQQAALAPQAVTVQ